MKRAMLILTACVAALPVLAADDLAKEIAPLLNQRTLAVVRLDVAAMDIDAGAKQIQSILEKASEDGKLSAEETKGLATLKENAAAFLKAGGKRLYVIITDMSMRQPPLVAISLGEKADTAALAKLFGVKLVTDGDPTTAPATTTSAPAAPPYAKEFGRLLLIGSSRLVERAANGLPAEREDIQKALASTGDAALVIAVVPPKAALAVAIKTMPTLPPILGGGDTAPLGAVNWISVGISAPPKLAASVTVQTNDADSAKALDDLIKQALDAVATTASQPASDSAGLGIMGLPQGIATGKALNLHVKGDQLVGAIDSKQMADVLDKQVVPLFREARKMAKRAASAANLRNIASATFMYVADNNEKMPLDFLSLKPYGITDKVLENPRMPDAKPGYVYVPMKRNIETVKRPAATVLAYENYKQWGDGIAVLFLDGHVEFVADQAKFKKMLEDTKKADEAK